MRFNDREIASLSSLKADLEGILCYMKPQGSDWSDWYQQPCFKERYFKLKANLLYYYRTNEQEPLGVLVLENVHVGYERPQRGIPFAFSLTFKVNDKLRDNEARHIFSCRCDADVNVWVSALKTASYEHWRSQYMILKAKLAMKIGKDPILEYIKSRNSSLSNFNNSSCKNEVKRSKTKSTFYSHIETNSTFYKDSSSSSDSKETIESTSKVDDSVENFITF